MKKAFSFLAMLLAAVCAHAASYSGTLPVLFINTEGGVSITSKENYVRATYWLDPMGVEGVKAIGTQAEPLGMQIRGRGNYSWTGFDKKPYRLKLDDKQPLLGMNKSKHFALLAHADDTFGFMRNIVGFQLSRMIGLAWTPADEPVEVVLNGDYIGLYFLTETIRVDKDRVNIVEQPDLATGAEEITGGWLVEIDNYDSDPHIEIYEKDSENSRIVFTYKTPKELSSQQKDYLTAQMTMANDAIYDPDLQNNEWENIIDAPTLARYFIVQEIVDDYESFHGSCYMYKNIGDGKWYFGPVWDFGNAFSYDKSQFIFEGRIWHNTWIKQIYAHPHFQEIVKEEWNKFSKGSLKEIYDYVDTYAARIKAASEADARRWPEYGTSNLQERVDIVTRRLQLSINWLNNQWAETERYYVEFMDTDANPWEEVYTYMWCSQNDNLIVLTKGWPGTPMTYNPETKVWSYTFNYVDLPDNAMIIFNNGHSGEGNQTADLKFVNNSLYNREGVIADGINDVISPECETIYYNVLGEKVQNPQPGLYIRVRGNKVDKIYIK